jgi:hypothetical protein
MQTDVEHSRYTHTHPIIIQQNILLFWAAAEHPELFRKEIFFYFSVSFDLNFVFLFSCCTDTAE